jgi:hypothetical protein
MKMKLTVIKNKYFDNHILLCFKDFLDSLSLFDATKFNYSIQAIDSDDINDHSYFSDVDWILIVGLDKKIKQFQKELRAYGVKIAIFWDDIHYHTEKNLEDRITLFKFCDLLLLPYYKQFLKREEFKYFWNKAVYFPWYAPKICFESNVDFEQRKNKILMSGRISDSYSFRKKIYEYYKDDETIEFLKHPGYDRERRKHIIIRDEYYKYLSNYKTAIATTAEIPLNYTVAKYFEIPACGCALVLQNTPDLNDLGFIENEHFILINEDNFKNLKDIIKNFNLKKISENVLKLIKEKHQVLNRIELLFKILEEK